MKSKVSFALDHLIDELRASAEAGPLDRIERDQKSKVITALIECREKVDEITRTRERPPITRDRFIIGQDIVCENTPGNGSGPGADAIRRILRTSIRGAEERIVEHAGIRNPLR